MLTKRDVILVKVESTYRQDSSPTSSDAILVEDPSWAYEGLRMNDRPAIRTSLGKMQKVFGGALKAVSFTAEIKGSGVAGTAPEIDALLEAGGMIGTNSPGTLEAYRFTSNPATHFSKSITVKYYQDGTLHTMTGCMVSSMAFNAAVGSPGKVTFTVIGHPSAHVDSVLVQPTYNSTVPPPVINSSFAAHGYAAAISALSLDAGIQLAMEPDVSKSNGYGRMTLTGRDPNGSFDPSATLVAEHDFLGRFEAGDKGAIVLGTVGSSSGNRWSMTLNGSYYTNVSPGDREGVRSYAIPYSLTDEDLADNEFVLVFS